MLQTHTLIYAFLRIHSEDGSKLLLMFGYACSSTVIRTTDSLASVSNLSGVQTGTSPVKTMCFCEQLLVFGKLESAAVYSCGSKPSDLYSMFGLLGQGKYTNNANAKVPFVFNFHVTFLHSQRSCNKIFCTVAPSRCQLFPAMAPNTCHSPERK